MPAEVVDAERVLRCNDNLSLNDKKCLVYPGIFCFSGLKSGAGNLASDF